MSRGHQLNVRVSDVEYARFDAVAKHYGLGIAQAVRFLMKREADKIAVEAPTPPKS